MHVSQASMLARDRETLVLESSVGTISCFFHWRPCLLGQAFAQVQIGHIGKPLALEMGVARSRALPATAPQPPLHAATG